MGELLSTWLQRLACAAVITIAGARLSRCGDIIADKTGLSGNWVGLALLATVTSLPELATGISAVTVAGSPNIAVGDVMGSCVFNLAILVVVGLLYRPRTRVLRAVGWVSIGLFTVYLLNSYVLYLHGE